MMGSKRFPPHEAKRILLPNPIIEGSRSGPFRFTEASGGFLDIFCFFTFFNGTFLLPLICSFLLFHVHRIIQRISRRPWMSRIMESMQSHKDNMFFFWDLSSENSKTPTYQQSNPKTE